MRAYLETADGRNLEKILKGQKQILRRLERLEYQRENVVLEKGDDAGLRLYKQYDSLNNSLKSVVSNLAAREKEWDSSVDVEDEVNHLTKTLITFLNTQLYLKEAQEKLRTTSGVNIDHRSVERKRELEAVVKNTGALVDRLRLSQAEGLAQRFYELARNKSEMKSRVVQFKTRLLELCPEERRGLLADEGGHIFKTWEDSLQEEVKVRKPGVLDYAARNIPLGITKRLNDKLLEFEAKRAEHASQMEERRYVRGLDETDEEKRQLEPIKKELQEAILRAEQSRKSDHQWTESFINEIKPTGDPFFIVVRAFRRVVASDDDPRRSIMFEYKGVAGADHNGIVFNVQPVDAKLRCELGTLQMKVSTKRQSKIIYDGPGIAILPRAKELALAELARGERLKTFSKRTGITGIRYAGRIVFWERDSRLEEGRLTVAAVEFFSPAVMGVREVYSTDRNRIPMQARAYIAQNFLRSVAHLHQYGFVHNSPSIRRVGIAEDGSVFITLEELNRPGAVRNEVLDINVPPESGKALWEGGEATGNFLTESWAVGVVLYLIFSENILPFYDTDKLFFRKLGKEETFDSAWRMTNIEAAAPNCDAMEFPMCGSTPYRCCSSEVERGAQQSCKSFRHIRSWGRGLCRHWKKMKCSDPRWWRAARDFVARRLLVR